MRMKMYREQSRRVGERARRDGLGMRNEVWVGERQVKVSQR